MGLDFLQVTFLAKFRKTSSNSRTWPSVPLGELLPQAFDSGGSVLIWLADSQAHAAGACLTRGFSIVAVNSAPPNGLGSIPKARA